MKSQSPMLHRSRLALSAFASLLAVALPLTASSAPPVKRPLPSIGEQRAFDLRIGPASLGKIFAVRADDAGFVKVHFDHFSLPDGVTLEVSNPARTEVYRYTNKSQKGQTNFSALSIDGPVALLRLVGTPTRAWRTTDGVHISRYLRGHSPSRMREVMRSLDGRAIIGNKDSRPVACYNSTDPVAVDRSRPVAFLVMNNGYVCTAWRVGPDNRMFTNNHCMSTDAGVKIAEVQFNRQATECGGTTSAPVVKVMGDQLLATDDPLDFTLFTVKDFASIAQFGYLGLETRAPALNEEIIISGHPAGRPKELSVVSDRDGGGRCRINSVGTGNGTLYYCDTEGGNSGSPVIARSSNKVIALHNAWTGGDYNTGVKMSLIWPQVSSYFGGVAPNGDTGSTPPPATYTVSGTVTTSTGAALAGVTVNAGSVSATTSSTGAYTLSGLANNTYTLTPSLSGYTFTPATRSVAVSGANVTGQNFTGTAASSGSTVVHNVNLPSVSSGRWSSAYQVAIPAGTTRLVVNISGGTGDADLYVNRGSALTTPLSTALNTTSRCVPLKDLSNTETCTINNPTVGSTYFITVHAYRSFSGVNMKATRSP